LFENMAGFSSNLTIMNSCRMLACCSHAAYAGINGACRVALTHGQMRADVYKKRQ
jgi:hypothetical protein